LKIIHFTDGATDPLQAFRAQRAKFVPLADGAGDTHLSCLHLQPGATIEDPSTTHAAALLVVHGEFTFLGREPTCRIHCLPGMGCLIGAGERYALESKDGAIILIVEAELLEASAQGISSPERIAGQRWPGERLHRGAA
jgi:hypothetical protein